MVSVTFFFFRRFRNTNRHLIFCDVHCGGPDISRNAGFLIMMPGLDWIMSSPLISPRKPSFMCESLFFCKHGNMVKIKLLWSFWILIFWSQIKKSELDSCFWNMQRSLLSCYFHSHNWPHSFLTLRQSGSTDLSNVAWVCSYNLCHAEAKQRAFWPWGSLLQRLLESVFGILNHTHHICSPMPWCSFSCWFLMKFGHSFPPCFRNLWWCWRYATC